MTFFTVPELAKLLKQSKSQIYAMIESGKLKCHRFSTKSQGGIRVSQAQLDAFLRDTETRAAPVGKYDHLDLG